MDRRGALKRLAAVAAGAVVLGGGGGAAFAAAATGARGGPGGGGHPPGHGAVPGDRGRARRARHRGRDLEVVEHGGGHVELRVDGRAMGHHVFERVGDGYASHLLPFAAAGDDLGHFADPLELAKVLVEEDGLSFVL